MPEIEPNNPLVSNSLAELEELLRVIHDEPDRDTVVRKVIWDLVEGGIGEAAWVWISGASPVGWKLLSACGLEADFCEHLLTLPAASPLNEKLTLGQEVVGGYPGQWGRFAEPLAAAGWCDAVILPIRELQRTVGALAVARRDGDFTGDQMHLLRGLSLALGTRRLCDDGAASAKENEADRLSVAIEHLAEAIIITDASGVIEYTNPAFTRITGYAREEVLGLNPRILRSGKHEPKFYRAMWETLGRGETWSGRLYNRTKAGALILEEARISPVRDSYGVVTHYVAVKRDVTAEVAVEQKLRETQKLEAIGTLAGGISHDFNNILYALAGYAQLALEELDENSPVRIYIDEIAKAGERAAGLVTKMMTFGQRSGAGREEMRLQEVVAESLELARASLPAMIEFELDMDVDCPAVEADAAQIRQMILNLCNNAGGAMREGGTLSVSLAVADVDSAAARDVHGLTPGRWVRLRIDDTGPGMDPAVLERIFEPYFTTKKLHEGTGLGLAVVHGIVKNHDGCIHVDSELGKGTIFTIFLPLVAQNQVVESPQEGAVMTDAKCRILLIDDEKMIVDMTVRGLTRFGFEVTGLTDGVQAVEVFRSDPFGFDAVITDQTMPQITGFEVAAKLLEIRPDLPVILTSGYNDLGGEDKVREAGIARMLPKPLKLADLARALEELTGAATK